MNEKSQEIVDAMNALYSKYGNNQTPEQKMEILHKELGESNISSTSDWRFSEEVIRDRNLMVLEIEYLRNIGVLNKIIY